MRRMLALCALFALAMVLTACDSGSDVDTGERKEPTTKRQAPGSGGGSDTGMESAGSDPSGGQAPDDGG